MKTLERRESIAHILAGEIDRLAYMVDEYEYFDAVGRTAEDFNGNVEKIAADLAYGNAEDYADWLWERCEDAVLSERDRERARAILNRLITYIIEI